MNDVCNTYKNIEHRLKHTFQTGDCCLNCQSFIPDVPLGICDKTKERIHPIGYCENYEKELNNEKEN